MDQLQIQAHLEYILENGNVYFQPPSSVKMVYPAIVYRIDLAETKFADNRPYRRTKRYAVTYISKTPNDPVPDKLADLPMSLFERFFTADNLNHYVYNIYF